MDQQDSCSRRTATPPRVPHGEQIKRDERRWREARRSRPAASTLSSSPTRACSPGAGEFPVKSASGGHSNALGAQLGTFGTPWNQGGALHNWLTGRPAVEFEAAARVGWIQERGTPSSRGSPPRATAEGRDWRVSISTTAGTSARSGPTWTAPPSVTPTGRSSGPPTASTSARRRTSTCRPSRPGRSRLQRVLHRPYRAGRMAGDQRLSAPRRRQPPADGRDSLQPQDFSHRDDQLADCFIEELPARFTSGSRSWWPRRRGKRQSSWTRRPRSYAAATTTTAPRCARATARADQQAEPWRRSRRGVQRGHT